MRAKCIGNLSSTAAEQNQGAHQQNQDAETMAQGRLRHAPDQPGSDLDADQRDQGKEPDGGPVELQAAVVARDPGDTTYHDQQERGAHRLLDGEAAEHLEGGHVEKATADPDEPGEDPDQAADEGDQGDRLAQRMLGRLDGTEEHGGGGEQHHDGEHGALEPGAGAEPQLGAQQRPDDGGRPEGDGGAQVDGAAAPVGERP